MHHDEANQAVRCGILQEGGGYRYDPAEHHGPTLYYLTLPLAWLTAGRSFANTTATTFRLVPVCFGVAALLLFAGLRRGVGRDGALLAAALGAVSPVLVFYNRMYIQESLLVAFACGAIVAGWQWTRSRHVGWAALTGVCLGLMFATKETAVLAYAAMAGGVVAVWRRGPAPGWRAVLVMLAAAGAVVALFYTSFGAHPRGVLDAVLAYGTYARRAGGVETAHVHPWWFYARELLWTHGRGVWWSEAGILALAAVGAWRGLAAAPDGARGDGPAAGAVSPGLVLFLAVYVVLQALAYSVIPYKTPWCVLPFWHPALLLAGVGGAALWRTRRTAAGRLAVATGVALVAAHLARQAWRAAITYDTDPRNPYVYAHTARDFLRLVERVEDVSRLRVEGRNLPIAVVAASDEHWPLPWYLRRYTRVGYWTSPEQVPAALDPVLVVVAPEVLEAMQARLGADWTVEYYGLRPGALLALCIRPDAWEAFIKTRRHPDPGRDR